MTATFTAQMSRRAATGQWRLYVALLGGESHWPEQDLGRGAAIPTVQQRSRALAALGYVLTDGTDREWTEDSAILGRPVVGGGADRVGHGAGGDGMNSVQIRSAERALSVGTWLIVAGATLYSILTVTPLMAAHTPDEWDWTAPILPLVVDAAVVIVVRLDSVLARLGGDGGGGRSCCGG